MSDEGRLLAVQLVNQQLAASQQTLQTENGQLRAEIQQLQQDKALLQKRLRELEKLHEELKLEYRRASGKSYQGRLETTKFGFGRSD